MITVTKESSVAIISREKAYCNNDQGGTADFTLYMVEVRIRGQTKAIKEFATEAEAVSHALRELAIKNV